MAFPERYTLLTSTFEFELKPHAYGRNLIKGKDSRLVKIEVTVIY